MLGHVGIRVETVCRFKIQIGSVKKERRGESATPKQTQDKMQIPLRILYEDNHLLAIDKPANLPTMGVSDSQPSLVKEAKSYLKRKYDKPGNVYLGVVSRLDAVTTGVVIFARTSKAAKRLTEMFRSHSVEKTYLAIVEGRIRPECGSCCDWLVKDEAERKMKVASSHQSPAKEARLNYRQVKAEQSYSVLEVALETGRKHQIRVQLASRGHPILGDRKYDSRRRFPAGIALHAQKIALDHPVKKTRLEIQSAPPKSWRPYLSAGELH
jgi:23S rRNA pseudouridine1911/1915/1917 synthase